MSPDRRHLRRNWDDLRTGDFMNVLFTASATITSDTEVEVLETVLSIAKGHLIYPAPLAGWEGRGVIEIRKLRGKPRATMAWSSFMTALNRSNRAWEALQEGLDSSERYLCDNSKVRRISARIAFVEPL